MDNKMPNMDESLVPLHYAHNMTLLRRRKDGSCKMINTVSSGRLITVFDGERLDAAAVVWCLHYGNWPKFPLTIVDGNPHNLTLDNIFPVRLASVRYRGTLERGRWSHPLDKSNTYGTERECRLNWNVLACEHYRADLTHVLAIEAQERVLKAHAKEPSRGLRDWEARQAASKKARAAHFAKNIAGSASSKPPKPKAIKGMVWHYWKKVWTSVPVPVHVSDDCRRRLCAFSRGAVRAEYQPLYAATWYFSEDGEVVLPLPYAKPTKSVSANE